MPKDNWLRSDKAGRSKRNTSPRTDAEVLSQRGNGHQAHRYILEDIAVGQCAEGFDPVIARLVLNGSCRCVLLVL